MNILINNNNCANSNLLRLGNHLYPILVGLTFYENIKEQYPNELVEIYFCNEYENNSEQKFSEYFLLNFPLLKNRINFISNKQFKELLEINNIIDYMKVDINDITIQDIYIQGYCQNVQYINFDKIRYYFLESPIYDFIHYLYGNVENYVSIHIRRGDYLQKQNTEIYYTLDKQYIINVIQTYFKNDKFIIISDDISWCKQNLSDISNVVEFVDIKYNMLDIYIMVDLCIPIITKGNIVSPSSFCMFGASCNSNKNMVINTPYYKQLELNYDPNLNIIPTWAIKYPII